MATVAARVANWVDVVAELLGTPLREFPVGIVGRGLIQTFDADIASRVWRSPDRQAGFTTVARRGATLGGHGLPETTSTMMRAANSTLLDHHPLVRWYALSGTAGPQTMSRVPVAIAQSARSGEVRDLLRGHGVEQQLSMPLAVEVASHGVLVVCRPGRCDFTDDDLRVATRLTPLFRSLRRQTELLGQSPPTAPPVDLSGRELAVTQLLAWGYTSTAISSALGCSPRTVEKHLEHLYRKLGVSDKVSAVREARKAGLLHEYRGADGRDGRRGPTKAPAGARSNES